MADHTEEIKTELVDLNGLTLEQVESLDESALSAALRHVLADAKNPGESFAGFQSRV